MTSVLIVCAAGASGTFLATRLRRLVAASAETLSVRATSLSALTSELEGVDAVLVGPQLREELESVRRSCSGIPVVLLEPDVFGAGGAEAALDTVREVLGAGALKHPQLANEQG